MEGRRERRGNRRGEKEPGSVKNDHQTGRYLLRGPEPGGWLGARGGAPGADYPKRCGNRFSPTVIAAAITSQKDKTKLPTHIQLSSQECGLARDSVVLLEQVRTIDKRRLKERMGRVEEPYMERVDHALSISFGLTPTGHGGAT